MRIVVIDGNNEADARRIKGREVKSIVFFRVLKKFDYQGYVNEGEKIDKKTSIGLN